MEWESVAVTLLYCDAFLQTKKSDTCLTYLFCTRLANDAITSVNHPASGSSLVIREAVMHGSSGREIGQK